MCVYDNITNASNQTYYKYIQSIAVFNTYFPFCMYDALLIVCTRRGCITKTMYSVGAWNLTWSETEKLDVFHWKNKTMAAGMFVRSLRYVYDVIAICL